MRKRITESVLQDYIDDRLDGRRRAAVERHLQKHPDVAAYVREQVAINDAMRHMADDVLNEPVPDRLLKVLRDADK